MALSPDQLTNTIETMRAIPQADVSTIRDIAQAVACRAYEISQDDNSTVGDARRASEIYDRFATREQMEAEASDWTLFWSINGVDAPSLSDFRARHVDTDGLEVLSNLNQKVCERKSEFVIAPIWSLQRWVDAFTRAGKSLYVTKDNTSELYGAEISPYNTVDYSWKEAARVLPYDPEFRRKAHRMYTEITFGGSQWTISPVHVKDGLQEGEILLNRDIPELHEALAVALRSMTLSIHESYKYGLDGQPCYGEGLLKPGAQYIPVVIPRGNCVVITSTQLNP